MKALNMVNNIQPNKGIAGGGAVGVGKGQNADPGLFKKALNEAGSIQPTGKALGAMPGQELMFSNHAVERMMTRGIQFGPEKMAKITEAISKARGKGAKETLVLTDNAALIVSVKNNKVVTVMDQNSLKENVFTNIDSTVMI
ncbi:MAG: TIGR02530 family flagellar biosynthesis protein [Pseudomonadota bacterium]